MLISQWYLAMQTYLDLSKKSVSRALHTLLLGGIVISFSNSALNPAIPIFMAAFSVDIVTGGWILNAYVMAMSVGLMLTGYLSTHYDKKHLYLLSIGLFSVGSMMGTLGNSMNVVITARAVQGFAGGITIPLSIGLIYQLYPKRYHGRMMALWGIVIMMSLALGPLVGAFLVETFTWRILFSITIPLSVLVILLTYYYFPKLTCDYISIKQCFDMFGFLGLLAILFGFAWWVQLLSSDPNIWTFVIGMALVLLTILWWRYELKQSWPLLDIGLFANKVYLHSNIISTTQTVGMMLSLLLLPIIIQDIMGYTALWTGLVLMVSTLVASITTHFAGKVVDTRGARGIGIMGIIVGVVGTFWFAFILPNPSLRLIMVVMIVRGIGVGLAYLPTMTVGFSNLPSHHVFTGVALNNISRRIFSTIVIALSAVYIDMRHRSVLVDTGIPAMTESMQEILILMGVIILLTIPSAVKLPKYVR